MVEQGLDLHVREDARLQERQQEQIYLYLEKLQEMTKQIPVMIQQRLPNELLSSLATSLVQGRIFEIVRMLLEVQHATEKQLFHRRLQFQKRCQDERREFDSRHQRLICEAKDDKEVLSLSGRLDVEKERMLTKHAEERKQLDSDLVLQIDQKVIDQQLTLEKAGVPGFHVTNNPTEIRVQMHLLDFISRLDPDKASLTPT